MSRSHPTLSSKRGNLAGVVRLSRPLNLVIAAGTMGALRYGWMERWTPAGHYTQLPLSDFLLAVLVVVLLMAAGNVINAYFDTTEDRINKPDRAIVDRLVKRRVLIIAHQALNTVGIGIACFLAWKYSGFGQFLLPVTVSFLLWRYSARWKSRPFIGNLVVAGLLGLVPIWLGIVESPFHTMGSERWELMWPLLGFGGMAFGIGMAREIAKDARDEAGDRVAGKNSIPIQFGRNAARMWVAGILFSMAAVYVSSILVLMPSMERGMLLPWMSPLPFILLAIFSSILKTPSWKWTDRWILVALIAGFVQCFWIPAP